MALTKEDLKQLEKRQDKNFKIHVDGLDDKFKKHVDALDNKFKKHVDVLDKKFERHTGVLYEKFQKDIKTLGEGWDSTKEKVDATFEMTGGLTEDVEVIKSDISFIKRSLKRKVDQEEFEALEKRVILVERKLSRV